VLHKAQDLRYLPGSPEFIAGALGLPVAKVMGVVKFYSLLHDVSKGKFRSRYVSEPRAKSASRRYVSESKSSRNTWAR
jgi:hypothetical protein